MRATPDQVRKVMQQYVQAWATGDKQLFLSLFAPDARWADPVGSPEFVGLAAIGGFWDFARKDSGRQLTPKVEEMRACANEGVLRFTMQVRIPARNEGLDLSIIDHFILNDAGQIQVARAFWDETTVSIPAGMKPFAPDVAEAHAKNGAAPAGA
jgi:steroid delta-isomerase